MSSYPQEAASRPLAGDTALSAVVPPQAGGLQGGQKLLHNIILCRKDSFPTSVPYPDPLVTSVERTEKMVSKSNFNILLKI